MIVCLPCQTPMVVGHEFYTAWVAQTQKEHPVEVASCPRCGCTVADVNRGIERQTPPPSPPSKATWRTAPAAPPTPVEPSTERRIVGGGEE